MKITAIKAWQVDLPLKEGRYSWSNGNFVEVFDSTFSTPDTLIGTLRRSKPRRLGLYTNMLTRARVVSLNVHA